MTRYDGDVQPALRPDAASVSLRNRRVWTDLARIFSTVCNPFLTALALFVILAHAFRNDTTGFWKLLFASTFFTSIGSKNPFCIANRTATCTSIRIGLKAGCLKSSTMRDPRSSCALVLASRSEPN